MQKPNNKSIVRVIEKHLTKPADYTQNPSRWCLLGTINSLGVYHTHLTNSRSVLDH